MGRKRQKWELGAEFVTRSFWVCDKKFVMLQIETTGSTLCKNDLKLSSSMKEENQTQTGVLVLNNSETK